MRVLVLMPISGSLLAEIQQRYGRNDEALATIEQALALAIQTGERVFLPAMHRIRAGLQRSERPYRCHIISISGLSPRCRSPALVCTIARAAGALRADDRCV